MCSVQLPVCSMHCSVQCIKCVLCCPVWTVIDVGGFNSEAKRQSEPIKRSISAHNFHCSVHCSVQCVLAVCSVNRGPTKRRQRQSKLRHCQSDPSNVCLLTNQGDIIPRQCVSFKPDIILITAGMLTSTVSPSVITRDNLLDDFDMTEISCDWCLMHKVF